MPPYCLFNVYRSFLRQCPVAYLRPFFPGLRAISLIKVPNLFLLFFSQWPPFFLIIFTDSHMCPFYLFASSENNSNIVRVPWTRFPPLHGRDPTSQKVESLYRQSLRPALWVSDLTPPFLQYTTPLSPLCLHFPFDSDNSPRQGFLF